MADIEIKFIADELGKDLEKISIQVEKELHSAVENLAQATYASMIAQVQAAALSSQNRSDYLRALKFTALGEGSFLIYLNNESANRVEEGQSPYSIKDQLLASTKTVRVGSRAGEPWVRTSKAGKKYASVPFEHSSKSLKNLKGDLGEDIKSILVRNSKGRKQRITKIFKDSGGNPLSGAVARVDSIPGNPNLGGLTKYQHVAESGKVSSIYMTYRMVHEDASGWRHPGSEGLQLFKEAEAYVERELANILNTLL